MTMTLEGRSVMGSGGLGRIWQVAAALILSALASCGGEFACLECAADDLRFYSATWLTTDPGGASVDAGQDALAVVTAGHDYGVYAGDGRVFEGVFIVPPTPGVTLTRTDEDCAIPAAFSPATTNCVKYQLRVTADAIAAGTSDVTLSAIWTSRPGSIPAAFFVAPADPSRTIERVETFRVSLRSTPPPVAPGFQIAVGAVPGGISATVATLPVTITRVGGFAEAVTLDYFPLTSGIAGGFITEPVPTDSRSLQLQIPARYAGGGRVDLRVTATSASGIVKVLDFAQFIEPMFRVSVEPAAASLTTAAPLTVDVSLEPGNAFRTTSLGPVELSLPDPPPGVTAVFIDDALPVGPVLPTIKVWRKLRLVTDGTQGVTGALTIRATARGVPPDISGVAPFVETTLDLTVQPGQFWQFVANNLTYGTKESNVIGTAMQGDNRPVVAWLEGAPSASRVFLRRYDGTTFAPSPPLADLGFGPVAPALSAAGGIAEASFTLTASDAGQVAFTYEGGARLALGRTEAGRPAWSTSPPFFVGDPADPATPRARSPRVAAGPAADAVVVSYIQEANAATTTGGVLHVLQTAGNGVLTELPTSLPGGALNAVATGSVVRHASALALRADGNPWVAWIEQPTTAGSLPKLWIRGYDRNEWGAAIGVPTPGTPVAASVQLVVEPSGLVVVAWLEGNPAQLKVLRYDPSSHVWEPLDLTGNARGSLNVTALSPALDVYLAREPGAQGRLLATWTEGDADPRVWIKRREADGNWRLVGTTVSQAGRWSKTPRVVSDSTHRLYVAWATYAAGQNPGTVLPYADIDVAQWVFP